MKKLFLLSAVWFILINAVVAQTIIQVGTTYNCSQGPSTTVRYQITIPYPGEFTMQINGWLSTYDWGDDFDRVYIYNDSLHVIGRNGFLPKVIHFFFI